MAMYSKSATPCPICGGHDYTVGPKGRRSPNGMMPRSAICGALERHRAYRIGFSAILPWCEGRTALQFSDDPAMPRTPFTMFEVSQFGGSNSLDLQSIDRDAASYDMVIVNHVLEHVADDNAALQELDRIVKPEGVVAISVPDLLRVQKTREYGRRRDDKHGHYRIYGPDIALRWQAAVPGWHALAVTVADPVTGAPDRLSFLSRSEATLEELFTLLRGASLAPRFVLRAGQLTEPAGSSRAD